MALYSFSRARKVELKGITILLAIIASVAGFYALAVIASGESAPEIDRQILQAFRSSSNAADPIGPAWIEEAARDITALGSITVLLLVTVTVSAVLYFTQLRARAAILLIATLFALASSSGLKQIIDRSRPELVDHQTRVFTRSFPSAHAMNSTAVYVTIASMLAGLARKKRVKTVSLAMGASIALLIGVSRTYLGVHWPTDVIAGWTGGIIIALCSVLLGQYVSHKSESYQLKNSGV